MEQRVSAITLGVSDLARSRRFYDALGLSGGREAGGEVVFYQLNGLILCLYNDLARDAAVEAAARGRGLFAIAHNVRERDEVDAVMARAEAAGARVTHPPRDTPWGGRTAYFADPDEHLWEIAWNPGWRISVDGATTLGD